MSLNSIINSNSKGLLTVNDPVMRRGVIEVTGTCIGIRPPATTQGFQNLFVTDGKVVFGFTCRFKPATDRVLRAPCVENYEVEVTSNNMVQLQVSFDSENQPLNERGGHLPREQKMFVNALMQECGLEAIKIAHKLE